MLELHVEDTTVNSSRIAIGWCISKELGEKILTSQKEANLLIIAHSENGSGETRKVVPLSDMLTYLDFKVPGKNKILTKVFIGAKLSRLKDVFLTKDYSSYATDVYGYDGKPRDFEHLFPNPEHVNLPNAELEVIVPSEVFAKEPPAWEKKWVNRLFRSKAFDQCNFRRRRIFAYTIQPILFISAFIVHALFTTVLRLLTVTHVNNRWMKDPFVTPDNDVSEEESYVRIIPKVIRTLFVQRLSINKSLLVFPCIALTPLFLLISSSIMHFNHVFHYSWLKALLLAPVVNLAIVGVGLLLTIIVGGIVWLLSDFRWMKLIINTVDKLLSSPPKYDYLDAETIDSLTCTGNPKLTIAQLPKKARTIRLRFEAFKTKVCRPFAG